MPDEQNELELFSAARPDERTGAAPRFHLRVTLHHANEWIQLAWMDPLTRSMVAEVRISYDPSGLGVYEGTWQLHEGDRQVISRSTWHASSIRARLNKFKQRFPLADSGVSVWATAPDGPNAPTDPDPFHPDSLPSGVSPWQWLARRIGDMFEAQRARFTERVRQPAQPDDPPAVQVARSFEHLRKMSAPAVASGCRLRITFDHVKNWIQLQWTDAATKAALGQMRIRCTGINRLTWDWESEGERNSESTTHHRASVRAKLNRLQQRFVVDDQDITVEAHRYDPSHRQRPTWVESLAVPAEAGSPWIFLEDEIIFMAEDMRGQFGPLGQLMQELGQPNADVTRFLQKEARRAEKEQQQRAELQARLRESQQRRLAAQHQRELERKARAVAGQVKEAIAKIQPRPPPRPPLPPVAVAIESPPLQFQDTLLPLSDLRGYFLRERAALWWVSNQSDDLLCLPYCRIERLEYQLRTALRVIGPLRGRALLSDEVGLGKTIEAGLVMKEYLTRGMIKRFLVLTVPSLVDQWEEELAEKFQLETATTNHASFRSAPASFWREHHGIIASLHTLKQPEHLAIAQSVNWDLLVIDEAHYLRNRTSQAWQAVNALPRQFLLLLTATPVQNSLDDLYNLVTLLQPGQLPSPKEFRERFIDKKRPHQPREPEELRRLLGQVMIRNTRANAGIPLPPRHADTVLFEPDDAERAFWQQWETELREKLAQFNASQSSLWGRLLLQTAGSSPAAWREALISFPDAGAARTWRDAAPLEPSWAKKCDLILPSTKGEGGVVIFTQFFHTQIALAERLKAAGAPTWVINGRTPAAERQPITEEFRRHGGALLLTHNGTEGRNLQFCHRLVNFDLPWNPMEIEQRIGRLHRLGQRHPVRICNLVQAGTLQEHLLQILQEKLNLFELVVGETGLILGERFSSDEFAEEILRRWRDSEGRVAEAMQTLGEELAAARAEYGQVKQLDETLFAKDYESM